MCFVLLVSIFILGMFAAPENKSELQYETTRKTNIQVYLAHKI